MKNEINLFASRYSWGFFFGLESYPPLLVVYSSILEFYPALLNCYPLFLMFFPSINKKHANPSEAIYVLGIIIYF